MNRILIALCCALAGQLTAQTTGDYFLYQWDGTKLVKVYTTTFPAATHAHTFSSLTSKPTTLSGYGITDAQPLSANLSSMASGTLTGDLAVGSTNHLTNGLWKLDDVVRAVTVRTPTLEIVGGFDASFGTTGYKAVFNLYGLTADRAIGMPNENGTLAVSGTISTRPFLMSTARILGRTTSGTGAIEQLTVGSGLTLSSGSLSADVTSVSGRTGAVTIALADVSGISASAATALADATNATGGLLSYSIIGTSGAAVPLLNTAVTFSGGVTLTTTNLTVGTSGAVAGTGRAIYVGDYVSSAGGQAQYVATRPGTYYWGIGHPGGVSATFIKMGGCANTVGTWAADANFGLWVDGGIAVGAMDCLISRDAAAVLAVKNSTTAQTLRVYGTTTGSKYLSLAHNGTNAVITDSATSCILQWGSGTPEGSVTAPVGSLYLRTDGGTSTTLYVKESGSGNTGWIAK